MPYLTCGANTMPLGGTTKPTNRDSSDAASGRALGAELGMLPLSDSSRSSVQHCVSPRKCDGKGVRGEEAGSSVRRGTPNTTPPPLLASPLSSLRMPCGRNSVMEWKLSAAVLANCVTHTHTHHAREHHHNSSQSASNSKAQETATSQQMAEVSTPAPCQRM